LCSVNNMSKRNFDRKFPFILAGHDNDDFIKKYHIISNKLAELEKEYQINDPSFEIDAMWTCYCFDDQIAFNVTENCCEPGLKARMLEIFNQVIT
jgi:hypothetical protein